MNGNRNTTIASLFGSNNFFPKRKEKLNLNQCFQFGFINVDMRLLLFFSDVMS
jgi:hypothetical protein